MKELPERERDDDGDIIGEDFECGFADWKDKPQTVLEEVDRLLKEHGLEVHNFETNADHYEFAIRKREA